MNQFPNRTTELHSFFIDKERIKSHIAYLNEEYTTLPLEEKEKKRKKIIEDTNQIQQKWKSNSTFTISLSTYLDQIYTITTPSASRKDIVKDTSTLEQNISTATITPTTTPYVAQSLPLPTAPQHNSTITSPPNRSTAQPLPHPTPKSIHNFFQSQNIVGEETNQELLIYGTIAGANIGIESLSGSGKSALLYALLESFPKESYCIIHQTTGKSLYNNPNINKPTYWVIPELQKVFTQDIEEIIKNLTEGISTTYTRTNAQKNGIDAFEIKKKSILYSFAITNSHLKQRDEEFHRRFIIINTDISKEQNKRIAQTFAEREFLTNPPDITNNIETENQLFKQHIKNCLAKQQQNDLSTKNPFFPYLIENLPQELTGTIRFRSAIKHLATLIKGSTAFYNSSTYSSLQHSTTNQPKYTFSTLFENQHTLSLYQSTLIANINTLSVIDQAVLSIMPDTEPLDYQTIQEKVNDQYMINSPLEETISSLTKKNILEKENNNYRLNNPIKISIDWQNALEHANKLMQQKYPQHRDEWYQKTQQQLENII